MIIVHSDDISALKQTQCPFGHDYLTVPENSCAENNKMTSDQTGRGRASTQGLTLILINMTREPIERQVNNYDKNPPGRQEHH